MFFTLDTKYSSDKLGDFKTAAVRNVTEKAVRFVRAHLAQAIVDKSPMSREDCMALVEHTLGEGEAVEEI